MKMRSPILRASLLVLALHAALSAHAVTLAVTSKGLATFTPDGNYAETVLAQDGGYGPLETLGYVSSGTPVFSGSYAGPTGRLFLDLTFVGNVSVGGSQTNYGTWQATGGLGTYAGASGAGTWATTLTPDGIGTHAYISSTTLSGELEAVPEPASLVALGLGLAAFRRRSLGSMGSSRSPSRSPHR